MNLYKESTTTTTITTTTTTVCIIPLSDVMTDMNYSNNYWGLGAFLS